MQNRAIATNAGELPSWQDATLVLRDGNTIGYARCGKPDSFTIIYLHGLPSSRGEAKLWDQEAMKLGLQLVATDRPGMGLSTHIAKRTINDYANHVAELIHHLQLKSYSILGVSGGGPYALACAAHKALFSGLHKVGVLAGLGSRELSQSGMSVIQWFSIIAMDYVPERLFCWFWDMAIGKAARQSDEKILEDRLRASLQAQKREETAYADERTARAMTAALRGAFTQGSKGYYDEATLVCRPWGFKLDAIENVQVSFWYGSKDGLAPVSAGEAMADSIAGSSFTSYEGESHTVVTLKHREEILTFLSS